MNYRMLKIILPSFALLLFVFLIDNSRNYAAQSGGLAASQTSGESDTVQKMIVESGSATLELDVNRLNGINSSGESGALLPSPQAHFAAAANSFFSILVFNDLLRRPAAGS